MTIKEKARGAAQDQRWAAQQSRAGAMIALLCRTAEGDTGSFAAFYDQTCARAYGVALQVLGDTGLAEETTQEVYLHVWRSACAFDPNNGTVLAWLTTLAHHCAVARLRSEQAYTTRAARASTPTHSRAFDVVTEEVIDGVECHTIKDGVASLSDRQRESITLAYYAGLTYQEVAEHLGVAVPTIKSRIRAGLIRLGECLDPRHRPGVPHAINEVRAETND